MAIPAVSGTPILAADMNSKASTAALDAETAAREAADDALDTALALKAPLASPTLSNPTLTGTVTVPDGALAIADTSGLQTALDAKVPASLVDAAGDLLVGTADNTVGRLAKGSALDVLRVNAGATALEWAAPSGGGSAVDAAPLAIGRYVTQPAFSVGGSATNVASGNGEMRTTPFYVGSARTLSAIAISVVTATAGATYRIGIYNQGSDGLPSSLVVDLGTVSAAAIAVVEVATTQALAAGRYFLAQAAQGSGTPSTRMLGGTVHIAGATATTANGSTCAYMNGVTGALPSTFTLTSMLAETPIFHVKVSA